MWYPVSSRAALQPVGRRWFDGALSTGQLGGVDYVDFASINSFSTFGGVWSVNLLNVLPVTWLNVQATPAGSNTIKIKWSVVAQTNNAGFAVKEALMASITSLLLPYRRR